MPRAGAVRAGSSCAGIAAGRNTRAAGGYIAGAPEGLSFREAAFLPMTILMALLGPVAGRLSARFSTRPVMVAGLLVAAAGALSLAFLPAGGSVFDVGWRFALIGTGAGLMNSPMSNTAVSSVDARHSGAASATHNMFRQMGGTLGVAALGTSVAAGHHAAGGATAAFGTGLSHAVTVVAAILVLCAILVAALGSDRSRQRSQPEDGVTGPAARTGFRAAGISPRGTGPDVRTGRAGPDLSP